MKQRFAKGELVKFTMKNPEKCGIIIDIHPTNTLNSKHTTHIAKNYSSVYYVLVEGLQVEGPYFSDELSGIN